MPASLPAVSRALSPSASEIRISGTVQGVGFRPTVWRLAREEGLVGEVLNDGDGVLIRTVGDADAIERLLHRIRTEAPVLSRIESMRTAPLASPPAFADFQIVESVGGENRTRIAADAAICAQCRDEVLDENDRRHGYPFTNCTHCGPRFSIVLSVPYDRPRTTMADFPMCEDCGKEYVDPADRRFHAQPIACAVCGPRLWIEPLEGVGTQPAASANVIAETAGHIRAGRIVALRGLGGFHLVCDARNADAVQRLRERKRRYAKPLALMARDLETIARFASIPPRAAELLKSPEAPIVLLPTNGAERLPDAIAPGLDMLGFMLPYTPLHVLLMEELDGPVVMTSANLSSEPQVIDNAEAREKLRGIADVFVMHDRDIANRIDDSVVTFAAGRPRILRRARGYAPSVIRLPQGFDNAPDVLAYGAELKSTFCLVKDGAAVLSQHQGDLEDEATFEDFQKNLRLYTHTYDHEPSILAADLHPEYLSTKLCNERIESVPLPTERIQHHHAHMASCMAENGLPLDTPPALGLILDGLGMGEDGTFWGGELLLGGYASAQRIGSLKPVAMIGGMQAIREPWRSTYAHLRAAMDWEEFTETYGSLELHGRLLRKPLATLDRMMAAGLNCPAASSCGRLFDAVAAAIGLNFDHAAYEGQGAMALEAAAARGMAAGEVSGPGYPFRTVTPTHDHIGQLDPAPMWHALLKDLYLGASKTAMAARFHLGLAHGLADLVNVTLATFTTKSAPRPDTIVLSGGCLQNAILLEELLRRLTAYGLTALSHEKVPANDGGIALGQAAIAAARHLRTRHHQHPHTHLQP
jgi:hydrogenase maturation protein HypF